MALRGNQRHRKKMGIHNPAECNHTIHGEYIHRKPVTAKDGKEIVELRQAYDIRDIIVPKREPLDIPGIIPKTEFDRLRKQAYVLSPAEKKALAEEAERKKIGLLNESQARKDKMKKTQLEQTAALGSILNEAETDAAKKSQYLLQRAFELRQEQEDEVKGINRIILASKCLAIREAQIAEKRLINKEMNEEEQRLDMMMEQKRQQGLQEEKKKEEAAEARSQAFVKQIKQQLKENEIKELIEAERKEEEARAMNRMLVAIKEEEIVIAKKKHEDKLKLQADLKQANDDLEKFRALQKEEENVANAKLLEFMRIKAEREAALEQQSRDIREAKARETARMGAIQMQAGDLIAQRQEQHAYRLQEEADRVWREKEKAAALKKKMSIAQLKIDRKKQIEEIRTAQALEIAQDEEDFRKITHMQYQDFMKEEAKLKDRKEKAYKNRKEILQQVNEKEMERIEMHKSKIEDGHAIMIEHELRDMRVKDTINRKIAALRECKVPEHSIADIQRQANIALHKLNPI